MKTNANDLKGANKVSHSAIEKMNETFQGSLPKDCGIYILPLFCQKSVTIKEQTREVIYSPFVIVKDSKIIAVELRPSSGLRQSLVTGLNEALKPSVRASKYADFDNTKTLVSCVNECFAKPLTSDKEVKTFRGIFENNTVSYTKDDTVQTTVYKFSTTPKFIVTPAEIKAQYEETLLEWIESDLCTEEDAKSWLIA